MTNIIYTNKDMLHTFILEGHADYNRGNDIVCSSISALITTLACSVKNNSDIMKYYKYDLSPGKAYVEYIVKEDKENEYKAVTEAIILGFSMLEQSYPDNVKMTLK